MGAVGEEILLTLIILNSEQLVSSDQLVMYLRVILFY